MKTHLYASKNEAIIYEKVIDDKGKTPINKILMGTYVQIIENIGDWYKVNTAGPNGWMHKNDLTEKMGLKVFFLDVGQGDGVLIEIGKLKILVDAGPNNSMYGYLTKWQYSYYIKKGEKIHIDYLIISHFDTDHYKGFIPILKDENFTFGQIIHPGILKFSTKNNPYNSGLGETIVQNNQKFLLKYFDDLLNIQESTPFNRDISNFIEALQTAVVQKIKRCEKGNMMINTTIEGQKFSIEVLAPITEKINQKKAFKYWKDDGQTINGHSLVLKLTFGERTLLLGGDLNTTSQEYLIQKYATNNPFAVDVAKSCHHGSSDFSIDFMQRINPLATVISSGDNEGHSHPRADAIGCAGKYSRNNRPLVYSTELARSTDLKNNKILFGMINLRCNGQDIFMSQMKEVKKSSDLWDSYQVNE
ncbi:MAG: MBL fold metallo-hydrolase [Bacteroidetes bacterium]|nr:MBL fold metallo-hydrolase [Bacteroidota bacterium]